MTTSSPRLHYGWHIVWSSTLGIFACLGLGRFALGMLLPAMGASLGLDYSQMGLISTINFTGYLLAVLVCGTVAARIGHRATIALALLIVGLSMMLIGISHAYLMILVLYFFTGLGSGGANVPIMALSSSWFTSSRRGRATGFVVIGSGFAILLAGKLVPWLNSRGGAEGWRSGWLVLGGLVLVVFLIDALVLRNSPRDMGLEPYGEKAPVADRGEWCEPEKRISRKNLAHLGALYFLFGATYVVYVTFIVTSMIRDRGFSEALAGNFWAWVGGLSLMSGPIFGTMSDRFSRRSALVTVFAIQAISYLFAGWQGLPHFFLYLSIGCFGITAWSIPSIMAALVGDLAGPRHAARVFGFITFIFSLGQISAPAAAGLMAERSGSFFSSFLITAFLAGLGAILASRLPKVTS
ncbi:MAG: MFS transporter [Proteobacteria bacterium]|nr:MFS transporter [Pseudomonadota bacterium]MBU1687120.1 MFS transporter [Pseudomonadota bacterium]